MHFLIICRSGDRKQSLKDHLSSSDEDEDDERDNEKEKILKERLQFYREKYGESSSLVPAGRDEDEAG